MHTFVGTKLFSQLVQVYLADDEYAGLQRSLDCQTGCRRRDSWVRRRQEAQMEGYGTWQARRPACGLLPRSREGQIWMLTIYAKNETENISAGILKKIKEEIDGTR